MTFDGDPGSLGSLVASVASGSDVRPLLVVLVALAAGMSRGFTGFGAGMIFIPAVGALYSPRLSIALLFLIDFIATTPLLLPHFREANWRELRPMLILSVVGFPFGLFFLTRLDPLLVRWALSLFIGLMVVVMASGWRYRGEPTPRVAGTIGVVSGFLSGAMGMGGPLIVLFWLGGQERAARVRANIFAYFGVFSFVSGIGYLLEGMLSLDLLIAALVLLPFYIGPIFFGSHVFRRSTDAGYRRAALAFCGAVALLSLPVWS